MSSLAEPHWAAVAFASGNGAQITLADPAASGAQRFYRVALEPLSTLAEVVQPLADHAKSNDPAFLTQYLDSSALGREAELAAMIIRSGMPDNFMDRAHIASENLLRLDYHDPENGCYFQVDLDRVPGGWKVKRIWFCR